jgi:hypothetical protein
VDLPAPNELTLDSAGDRAARRLDTFFERLDRLPSDRLDALAVRPVDPDVHAAAVARAAAAAERLGRAELRQRADEAIEESIMRRLSADALRYGAAVVVSATGLRPDDVVRLVATLRDAALAVLADDDLDAEASAELVGPSEPLVRGLVRP